MQNDSYNYDSLGNLFTRNPASGAASVRPHAVSSITGTVYGVANPAFSYDGNGNRTAGTQRNITWMSFNLPQGKVGSQVSDVSKGFPQGGRMSNWAIRDQEILIQDFIRADAITRIK